MAEPAAIRLFSDVQNHSVPAPEPTVRMKLRDAFPLLVHAHRYSHLWLKDLADDEIVVTRDLAQVIEQFAEIVAEQRRA